MKRYRFTSIVTILCMLINLLVYVPVFASTNVISGNIWFDANGNGKWESNYVHEYDISGVTVSLLDGNNSVLDTTTTNNNGEYYFNGLGTSSYKIKVTLPTGYDFTDSGNGNGSGVKYRLTKTDPSTGITDLIQPTKTDVNIGLIKGSGATEGDLLDISRNTNVERIKQGDTFDVEYTIIPKNISSQQNNTEKDIILVIDTSTSMNYIPTKNEKPKNSNEKSRLQIIKEVANNFVDKFKNNSKVNIALVDYNKLAETQISLLNMGNYNNVSKLTSAISGLKTDSNTNTGDGLREAYYILNEDNNHEKYILLMTDGDANTYSVVSKNNLNYYMGSSHNDWYASKGNGDPKGLEYAKKVASEKIAPSEIKSFIVGFSTEANPNNKEIAQAAGGTYLQALNETSLNNVYNEVQKQIDSTIYGEASFQESFSENLEISSSTSLPNGLSVSGNKVVGNFNVEYTLNSDKTQFTAVPIKFNVKYRAKSSGSYILGLGGNSSFGRISVSNNTQIKYFGQKSIEAILQNGEYLDISRSISEGSVKVGDSFGAQYTITPKPMPVVKDNTKKDIVLVIDTSGSMNDKINGTNKINTIKAVAQSFIDKFNNSSNFNIGLVEYSSYACKVSDIMSVPSNSTTLKNKIGNLQTGGATNIGDGIRMAKAMLNNDTLTKEKYIILMTDGVATAYSKDKNGNKYTIYDWYGSQSIYLDDYLGLTINTTINHESASNGGTYNGSTYITYNGVQSTTDTDALNYAKNVVSNMIKNDDTIKQITVVGFGTGASGSNAQIVEAAGGYNDSNNQYVAKGKYYSASDADALQKFYNQLAEGIISSIHGTVSFQEEFNENLEVENPDSLQYGLKVEGNKVVGNIDVNYALNTEKTQFVANPINLTVNYKAKNYGDGILGNSANSSFARMSIANYNETKYLDRRVIKLKDGTPPTSPIINANEGWFNTPVRVSIMPGSDLESGVNRTEYKIDGLVNEDWKTYTGEFYVNNEGITTISARTIDNGENISAVSEKVARIDMTPPTSPTINWNAASRTVTVVPGVDSLSGLNRTEYSIIINGTTTTNWTMYSTPFTLTNTSNLIIKARTVDNAGNISYVTEYEPESIKPDVNIRVRDASGVRDVYDVTSNNNNNRVEKLLDPEVKLQGKSYADISFNSKENNQVFQYKVHKYSGGTSELELGSITGWQTLDLQQQQVNNDVVIDKQGYLNWRGYDVSHMPTLTGTSNWSDPEQVFKYPYASTSYKSANVSSNVGEYGNWEDILPYTVDNVNGQNTVINKRWVTNSVFLENMNIGGDYKEASKFWGYIKVPSDGDYYFGAQSDDGCRGYITVDGVTSSFVDMFKPQSSTFGTKNQVFHLKAGTYYPIYIEYFNWGGWADFRIQYKSNNASSWNAVPTGWFYPSESITPGEYATTIFTGSAGVEIPSESGSYYIVYRSGQQGDNGNITEVTREGIYGPFVVEQRAGLNLSRGINDSNFTVGDEVKIDYTITPSPFDVYSVYPNGGQNAPQTYTSAVSDLNYEDILPLGLTPIEKDSSTVVNGQKISVKLSNTITYTKVGDQYIAQPITFSIYARVDQDKEYILEGENAVLTYIDIDGAQRQGEFPTLQFSVDDKVKSELIKHGLFISGNKSIDYIKQGDNFNIVKGMRENLAFKANIKNSSTNISWQINTESDNEPAKLYIYELNQTNNTVLVYSKETNVNNLNSSINGFTFIKNKSYIIVCSFIPSANTSGGGTVTSTVSVDGTESEQRLQIKIVPLPKLN